MNCGERFYRYIYHHHGGYQIKKDNIHYGWYDDIRWALYDRDRLEECNWDLGEFVYLPEIPNKYMNMELPPMDCKRYRQYIYINSNGGFRIQKKINGVLKSFGCYDTLDEAISKRNELMELNWNEHSK